MLDIGFTERDIKLINNRSHNLYNFKKLYQYLREGGEKAVKAIEDIYSQSGQQLSASDVTTIYRA